LNETIRNMFDESVEEHFLLLTNFFVMVDAMDTEVNKWKTLIGGVECFGIV